MQCAWVRLALGFRRIAAVAAVVVAVVASAAAVVAVEYVDVGGGR